MLDVQIDREKHAKLKYLIALSGSSFSAIASDLGVSPSTVSSVSLGRSRSSRIERYIASTIGKPVEAVFPERYLKGGSE